MSIRDIIDSRGITEVVHFTTNKGLLGILDSKRLLSRERITKDDRLEYILKCNSKFRKDQDWLDYVNLSISEINTSFFSTSSEKWHIDGDVWWCILSFDPEILGHEGVYFATTNNMYTSVERNQGCEGLESLFSQPIKQYKSKIVVRDSAKPRNFTTCNQAEVLYPEFVSTSFLRSIYVNNEDDIDQVKAQIAAVGHPNVDVIFDQSKFSGTD